MKRIAAIVSLCAVVTAASVTQAVTVQSFDNFLPDSVYGHWPDATFTQGTTNLEVQATGFGGGYANIGDPFIIDGTGTNTIQLMATVKSGVAGFIVALGDTTGHEWNYAWYGNVVGGGVNGSNDYVFTKPISSYNFSTGAAGQLDITQIDYMHIQVDPGGPNLTTPYDVTYNDLSLISGAANLTFNNTGGTGDGTTFDVGVNQNFNNGAAPATFSQGDNVSFTNTNNGHTTVKFNSVVNPGSTTVNSSAAYVFNGTGGIGGPGGLTVSGSGSLTLNTTNTYAGTTTVNSGATLTVNGSIPNTALIANGNVVFGANAGTGVLVRTVGPITLASGGKVSVAAPTASANRTLLISTAPTFGGSAPAFQGILDLGANDMIVRSGSASTIRTQLLAGKNGSAGITSSAALTLVSNKTAIGYAAVTAAGTFDGQPVAAGDVILKYTLIGDANLDSVVNFDDLLALAKSYNGTSTTWTGGDFTYDGVTNFDDLLGLAANYNKTLGASQQIELGTAVLGDYALAKSLVPEPAALSLFAVGATALTARRRRNHQ